MNPVTLVEAQQLKAQASSLTSEVKMLNLEKARLIKENDELKTQFNNLQKHIQSLKNKQAIIEHYLKEKQKIVSNILELQSERTQLENNIQDLKLSINREIESLNQIKEYREQFV